MRRLSRALALAGVMILDACSSTGGHDASVPKCTCGTLAGEVNGCHHPACASGHTNPDNPKCHCGPITVTKPAGGGY